MVKRYDNYIVTGTVGNIYITCQQHLWLEAPTHRETLSPVDWYTWCVIVRNYIYGDSSSVIITRTTNKLKLSFISINS